MIRALGLALYGQLAASTRYRLGQYVPGLRELGIDLQIRSLLGDDYLQRRFDGGPLPLGSMLRDSVSRLQQLREQKRFDAAIVYCEVFPLLPAVLERALLRLPYVYDMDDAFYLRYRIGLKRVLEPLLGDKFDKVMQRAAAVTAGNRTLADYAGVHNRNVTELPTVVDTDRYVPRPQRKPGVFTVGWIGSPSTSVYLNELVEPLSRLGRELTLRLVLVGGKAPAPIPNVDVLEIPWQEESEVDLINTFDVGVMPLTDDPWARGKCAFKLIQYMACGVPAIASPVGANVDVLTPGCGLMAANAAEWMAALRELQSDASRRLTMGEAARQRVVEHYSLAGSVPRFADVIRGAARSASP